MKMNYNQYLPSCESSIEMHFCYAWQLNTSPSNFRANDDREPSNAAGMPIHGQIRSFGLTNVLVIVVRIFGGTKLGVGGFIRAYRETAKMALNNANLKKMIKTQKFKVSCQYVDLQQVLRIIKKNNWEIISQKMEMSCLMRISVAKSNEKSVYVAFKNLLRVKV